MITFEKIKDFGGQTYLVKRDGVAIGIIEKQKDTRTDTFPWRIFACKKDIQPNDVVVRFWSRRKVRPSELAMMQADDVHNYYGNLATAKEFARSYFAK